MNPSQLVLKILNTCIRMEQPLTGNTSFYGNYLGILMSGSKYSITKHTGRIGFIDKIELDFIRFDSVNDVFVLHIDDTLVFQRG